MGIHRLAHYLGQTSMDFNFPDHLFFHDACGKAGSLYHCYEVNASSTHSLLFYELAEDGTSMPQKRIAVLNKV